jgi:hypothetical protein
VEVIQGHEQDRDTAQAIEGGECVGARGLGMARSAGLSGLGGLGLDCLE